MEILQTEERGDKLVEGLPQFDETVGQPNAGVELTAGNCGVGCIAPNCYDSSGNCTVNFLVNYDADCQTEPNEKNPDLEVPAIVAQTVCARTVSIQ